MEALLAYDSDSEVNETADSKTKVSTSTQAKSFWKNEYTSISNIYLEKLYGPQPETDNFNDLRDLTEGENTETDFCLEETVEPDYSNNQNYFSSRPKNTAERRRQNTESYSVGGHPEVQRNPSFIEGAYIPKRFRQSPPTTVIHDKSAESNTGELPTTTLQKKDKQNACALLQPLPWISYKISTVNQSVSRLPHKKQAEFRGHSGAVNHVYWSSVLDYSHLLASCSMDATVRIWDVFGSKSCVQTLNCHTSAIKDCKWSSCSQKILSGSFDTTACLSDVETGQLLKDFKHDSYVTCVQFHPSNPNLFICGTYKSLVVGWDTRTDKAIRQYKGSFGQTLDLEFLRERDEFVSSTDTVSRDSADKNVMVWDFASAAVMSNQIFHERYTIPCLKLHPQENVFIGQTNGDYIAVFSANKPYRMNKYKRYEGHRVQGYNIGCGFSGDGKYVISGSEDGTAHFYYYNSAQLVKTISCSEDACVDVSWHPVLTTTVALCTWDGSVLVWN